MRPRELTRAHLEPPPVSVEFQRLERLRVRQRTRRRHQLRVLAVLGAAATVIVGIGGLASRSPAARLLGATGAGASARLELAGDAQGQTQGRVQAVEPDTGIVRLSSGFLGLMSVAIHVTPRTLIIVGDKEGGIGDIRPGERVRAAYEARAGVREATRVDLFLRVVSDER
jgi:hypothetical protein